jgi:NAD(P)-dependent dehydrogenase (short-subunit alcohol dehydrogenase family)
MLCRGATVLIVGRDPVKGARALEGLSDDSVAYFEGDVSDPTTATASVAAAIDHFGPLDILVNNAAIDHHEPLLEVTPATAIEVIRVNFLGSLWMIQAAAREMRGRGGAIVNVSSRLASVGVPDMSVYGAAKGALAALTRGAAVDLAPHGIRVNAVAPGFTETPLFTAWLDLQPDPPVALAAATSDIPLGRLARPNDVATAVAFLASDESQYITGVSLPVDGGFTAR